MAFCSKCGARLEQGSRFCSKCGQAVPPSHGAPAGAAPAGGAPAGGTPAGAVLSGAARGLAKAIVRDIDASPSPGETVISSWQGGTSAPAFPKPAIASPQAAVPAAARNRPRQQGADPPSQRPGETAPTRKRSKLPLVIGAVAAVAIVALFALYVVPLFIPHPHDPNSHIALTSDPSQNVSGASGASSTANTTNSTNASSTSSGTNGTTATGSSNTSDQANPASSASSTTTVPKSYSTYERPTLADFNWLTGEAAKGNVPAGAQRILDLGALTGSWKGYIFGAGAEWLTNPLIDVGQSGTTVGIDWFYVHFDETGEGMEDTTPTSVFTGSFDGGMLDATGPGRITLVAFWEQDGRQYATGSLTWPDGDVCTIALVRP